MKQLFTLLMSFFLFQGLLIGQSFSYPKFTYYQNPNTGDYIFIPPIGQDSLNTYYWSLERNFSNYWPYCSIDSLAVSGNVITHSYSGPMSDWVFMFALGPNIDSFTECFGLLQTVEVNIDTIQEASCPIFYTKSNTVPRTFTFSSPGSSSPSNWSIGNDTTILNSYGFTYTFPEAGVYNICLETMGENSNCNKCDVLIVWGDSVLADPAPCDADFYTYSEGYACHFIPSGNINTSNTNFYWDFGDGTTSTEVYPYHVFDHDDLFPILGGVWTETKLLTYNQEGCIDTCWNFPLFNYSPGYVGDSCFVYFLFTQQNPFEVNIVNLSIVNNATYTWTLTPTDGNSIIQTGPYPTFSSDFIGSYSLCLSVNNGIGCNLTFCDTITLENNGFSNGKLSATGITFNVVSPQEITGYEVSAIDNSSNSTFKVFPNPFSEFLLISDEGADIKNYEIYSIDGKQVISGLVEESNHSIKTTFLNNGMYFIILTDSRGERYIKKIIKS